MRDNWGLGFVGETRATTLIVILRNEEKIMHTFVVDCVFALVATPDRIETHLSYVNLNIINETIKDPDTKLIKKTLAVPLKFSKQLIYIVNESEEIAHISNVEWAHVRGWAILSTDSCEPPVWGLKSEKIEPALQNTQDLCEVMSTILENKEITEEEVDNLINHFNLNDKVWYVVVEVEELNELINKKKMF